MSKKDFSIRVIDKKDAKKILNRFHYLSKLSRGFKSGFNYGLFDQNNLVGVIIFTGFPVPELSVGMLGLPREDQNGLFELSRLCIEPTTQINEHNIASWFISRAIRQLRKDTKVRIILSYADSNYHSGIVYMACNFNYYGLSDRKKDFWILQNDGSYVKHSRGKIKNIIGEWRARSQKHRFALIFDKELSVKWTQEKWDKSNFLFLYR